MTNPHKDNEELRISIRHKVNDAFQHGEESKGLLDYKTANVALNLIVDQILSLIAAHDKEVEREARDSLLFDLDEIDNKPWRVFRQLATLMPHYADIYLRYEAFYSYGGGSEVRKLIEDFEKTDNFKESGFPEMIAEATLQAEKEEK